MSVNFLLGVVRELFNIKVFLAGWAGARGVGITERMGAVLG